MKCENAFTYFQQLSLSHQIPLLLYALVFMGNMNFFATRLFVAQYDKGNALEALENYSEAIPYFDKALTLDPKHVLAMIGKGYALDKLGNHTQAVFYYEKAKATDPRYIPDLTNKANFLDKIGNYNLAIVYYDKALAIDPKNIDAIESKQKAMSDLNQTE
jgi:tetratricopeptide (TPR) repeat protein